MFILHFAVVRPFVSAFLCLLCIASHAQLLLKGKILHYDGKSTVSYNPTLEGINTAYAYSNEVIPNSRGEFQISYANEGLGTLRLSFNGITYSFIHDGTSEINLTIDQAKISFPKKGSIARSKKDYIRDSVKQAATVSISGDLHWINNFNNSMIRSSTRAFSVQGSDFSLLIKHAKTPERAVFVLDSLVQLELNLINKIETNLSGDTKVHQNLSEEARQYLTGQVYAFYSSVFLNGIMLKRAEQRNALLKDPNAPLSIYNKQWEKIIEQYIHNVSKHITVTPTSFEHIEFMLTLDYTLANYKDYNLIRPFTTNDELIIGHLLEGNPAMDSLFALSKNSIMAYKLHNLSRFLNTQTFYSPTLLYAFEELQKRNPGSIHLSHFEEEVTKLKSYLNAASKGFEKAIIINKNYILFEDFLENFKGKNVLLDVWATWCPPCFDDFNHKGKIQPLIDQGIITVVYVSLDKQEWRKKWRESIRFNQLEGYHLLADDVIKEDMWKFLGGNEGVIPRYALIDKNGNLFLKEAARLRQGDLLVEQIKELNNAGQK